MSARAEWEKHPNIHGMAGFLLHIHDSFRRTSAELVTLSGAGADALPRMRRLFSPLLHTLHHHHLIEEQSLFPLVRTQTGDHPALLVEEHGTMMSRLGEVAEALKNDDVDEIARLMRLLDEELVAHLAAEEAIAIPVLLELTHAEATRLLYGIT